MGYELNKEQRKVLRSALEEICAICPNEVRCETRDGVMGCKFYMNNAEEFSKDIVKFREIFG